MNNGATKKKPTMHAHLDVNNTSSIRFLILSSAIFSIVLTAYAFNAFTYFANGNSLLTEIQRAFDSSILKTTTALFLALLGLAYYSSKRQPNLSVLLLTATITFATLNACTKFDIATQGIALYLLSTLWCLSKLPRMAFVNSSLLALAGLSIGVIAIDLLNIAPSYPIAQQAPQLNSLLSTLFSGLFILCGFFNILAFSNLSSAVNKEQEQPHTDNKEAPSKPLHAPVSQYVADNLNDKPFAGNGYKAM